MAWLQRLQELISKPLTEPAIADLYNVCVAQARQPVFYQTYAVPDTIDGRFDLLLLHVFMLMHRLGDEEYAKQQLFDLMFADMDRSLREMGVGDMSISRKIKPMISAFYGRGFAYQRALHGSDAELAATLQRNLFGNVEVEASVPIKMAAYVRRAVATLEEQAIKTILSGQVAFPAPVAT